MLGDLVEYRGETGVICCLDPMIMRCTHFHSYVPLTDTPKVIVKSYDESVTIRQEVVDRIREYMAKNDIA